MKIYTKTGDKGKTALVGGKRVAKNNIRIEAYGTTDELISFIGLLRDNDLDDDIKSFLLQIQKDLMVLSAILASENSHVIQQLPKLSENSIVELEKEIDKIDEGLPVLKSFLIPGGHPIVSICHVCRTVCRRAERRIYDLMEEEKLNQEIPAYFNRLSDYLFILSRHISKVKKVDEIIWEPMLDK